VIRTKAPGKLFLLGEYVVLFGGPALLISVDRYLHVAIESSPSAFRIRSLGAELPTLEGNWVQGRIDWSNLTPQHKLVTTVIDALTQDGVIHSALPPFDLCIDSRELFVDGIKLGFGSSAAVTHALARALVDYANYCEAQQRHAITPEWVFNVHRAYQQGRGSGADIAAGVIGGSFSFQRLSDHCVPHIEPITLPSDLHCRYVWVGKAASTTEVLGQLQQIQQSRPARFSHLLTPLMVLAETGKSALEEGDVARFLAIAQSYCHNLSDFGDKVGIDIVSKEHLNLSKISSQVGVSYKPSGAGGGDFGIAFSSDINSLSEFERRAAKVGCEVVSLALGLPCHRY